MESNELLTEAQYRLVFLKANALFKEVWRDNLEKYHWEYFGEDITDSQCLFAIKRGKDKILFFLNGQSLNALYTNSDEPNISFVRSSYFFRTTDFINIELWRNKWQRSLDILNKHGILSGEWIKEQKLKRII
jgi:hypothetical protein